MELKSYIMFVEEACLCLTLYTVDVFFDFKFMLIYYIYIVAFSYQIITLNIFMS